MDVLPAPARGARAPSDRLIAALALRQHGLVTIGQLIALGLSRQAVHDRVRRGALHPVHRGVYAVGHAALSGSGRALAAVLAVGPGAALSHRSAAALWGIRQHSGRFEVTAPTQRRDRRGIRVHRSGTLAGNVTRLDGIPVTTPARTLTDLADVLVPTALRRALETAERLRLVDRDELVGAPGRRRVVRDRHRFTRSGAEAALADAFERLGVPRFETNQVVGPWEVDYLWRDARVVLELDFYATHRGRWAWQRDLAKTAWLQDHGFRVLREPGESIDPVAVARRVLRELGA